MATGFRGLSGRWRSRFFGSGYRNLCRRAAVGGCSGSRWWGYYSGTCKSCYRRHDRSAHSSRGCPGLYRTTPTLLLTGEPHRGNSIPQRARCPRLRHGSRDGQLAVKLGASWCGTGWARLRRTGCWSSTTRGPRRIRNCGSAYTGSSPSDYCLDSGMSSSCSTGGYNRNTYRPTDRNYQTRGGSSSTVRWDSGSRSTTAGSWNCSCR